MTLTSHAPPYSCLRAKHICCLASTSLKERHMAEAGPGPHAYGRGCMAFLNQMLEPRLAWWLGWELLTSMLSALPWESGPHPQLHSASLRPQILRRGSVLSGNSVSSSQWPGLPSSTAHPPETSARSVSEPLSSEDNTGPQFLLRSPGARKYFGRLVIFIFDNVIQYT